MKPPLAFIRLVSAILNGDRRTIQAVSRSGVPERDLARHAADANSAEWTVPKEFLGRGERGQSVEPHGNPDP